MMLIKKNIKVGNLNKFNLSFIIFIFFTQISFSEVNNNFIGVNTDIKILDKISSKNELVKLRNGEEGIYKDLAIRVLKCTNSELDDNPEIKAYIQVRDLTKKNNDKVVFAELPEIPKNLQIESTEVLIKARNK